MTLDEVIGAGLRTGDPLVEGQDLLDDGPAQGHQRRFAQHPLGVVRAPVRRRVGLAARPTSRPPSCAR